MADYGSLPFDEQVAFFRNKLNLPTARWDDITQAAHDRAFVVAGAMQADLIADLRAAVAQGIEQGTTLETFRQDFDQIVAKHGWTGWTGEGSAAGRAWRTNVIYATNLRSSYAAGRYQQLQDIKHRRPYWRYVHNDTVTHPRPQHLAWDGTVLPADDPWWGTHFAPNGWGCRCRIESLAARDLQRDGIDPKTLTRPSAPDDLTGIDKGWGYAPGRTWHPDLDKYPHDIARELVAANMNDGVFDRWQARIAAQVAHELGKPEYANLGKEAAILKLRETLSRREEYPVAAIPSDKAALLGLRTQTLLFSDYDAIKQAYSRKDDPNFSVHAYREVQRILDDPELIVRETGQMTVWFRRAGRLFVAVIAQTGTGKGAYLKSLRYGAEKEKARALRKGEAIYRKEDSQAGDSLQPPI